MKPQLRRHLASAGVVISLASVVACTDNDPDPSGSSVPVSSSASASPSMAGTAQVLSDAELMAVLVGLENVHGVPARVVDTAKIRGDRELPGDGDFAPGYQPGECELFDPESSALNPEILNVEFAEAIVPESGQESPGRPRRSGSASPSGNAGPAPPAGEILILIKSAPRTVLEESAFSYTHQQFTDCMNFRMSVPEGSIYDGQFEVRRW
ncbi:hypothetical protein [Arthrobacter sp. VKM Ac-2550]|uniref:hypothetical protein n=1 Tax=Crystallibacter permensis TaxID=1938888 RepID=UPI0022280C8B|nr:hypothetical protein [Arthrobacter sp. VKM Ac-2550]MCW2132547.1 hypothetical protein [Arthrobacter sp. VKM Ac-2550]